MENALTKYNMGDEKTIKEIIDEVDSDNVPLFLPSLLFHILVLIFSYPNMKLYIQVKTPKPLAGWKN